LVSAPEEEMNIDLVKYIGEHIRNIAPNLAKLTIARDMLATIWVMWKKGEKYNPEIRERATHKQS
jgi:hypothetical protein